MQGAIVANYPWDGSTNPNTSYSASPDDAAFRHLASVYANAHLDMHKSQEFPGGITNGAHWYPLSGGMQVRTCYHPLLEMCILDHTCVNQCTCPLACSACSGVYPSLQSSLCLTHIA